MNTRSKLPYLSGFLLLLASGLIGITPALAASATATVSVTVVRNVSITNKADMSFGHISTSASAGSVILGQNGDRQANGGVILESGGNHTPAKFVATGEPNASFSISLPASTRMTDSKGNEMVVSHFSTDSGKVATFNANGSHELDIGATLIVNPNQALGHYAGSMSITVNYN